MSEDEELGRIYKKKMEEIMQRATRTGQESGGKPITLNDSNFSQEISSHKLTVVDFWAPWCGPCRMVGPIIEQLASEYAGRVTFGKLNVDENPRVSNMFGVRSIPTMIVFKDGKAVDGMVGAGPKSIIESKFKPYLDNAGTSTLYG